MPRFCPPGARLGGWFHQSIRPEENGSPRDYGDWLVLKGYQDACCEKRWSGGYRRQQPRSADPDQKRIPTPWDPGRTTPDPAASDTNGSRYRVEDGSEYLPKSLDSDRYESGPAGGVLLS